jgi:hypothetical protein
MVSSSLPVILLSDTKQSLRARCSVFRASRNVRRASDAPGELPCSPLAWLDWQIRMELSGAIKLSLGAPSQPTARVGKHREI